MKKFVSILFLVLLVFVINSCKKDFSIYAPGESITIITGLLDPSQDTQFVKINKTWQGDGNNLVYATVRDSSEYQWEEFNDITIKEIVDGQTINTYHLSETEHHDKEDGLFYGPDYTVYYFVKPESEPFLENAKYRLDVDFKDHKDVWSETKIVVPSTGTIEKPNASFKVKFGSVSNGQVSYFPFSTRWYPYDNAGLYSAAFDIRYKEMVWEDDAHTVLLSEEDKVIQWNLGTKEIDDISNGRYSLTADGETFYNLLKINMEVDPKITRQLGYLNTDLDTEVLDFSLSIANSDYRDFIVVNQPSTTIVQERPQYTNITNGIGIFASRTKIDVKNIALNYTTYNAIPWVDELGQLNICTPEITSDIVCQ